MRHEEATGGTQRHGASSYTINQINDALDALNEGRILGRSMIRF